MAADAKVDRNILEDSFPKEDAPSAAPILTATKFTSTSTRTKSTSFQRTATTSGEASIITMTTTEDSLLSCCMRC